jgi:hypothetical protein
MVSQKTVAICAMLVLIFSLTPSLPAHAASVLTFGSGTVFETGDSTYIDVAALDQTTVVISYRDEGNSNRGTAVVGTISGNSISFGTPVVFYNDNASYIAITKLDSDSVVIGYTDVDSDASAIVGDVSGTSISFNTAAEFTADSTNWKDIARLDDTHFIVAWNNAVGTQIDATVGTVSAGSISYGSTTTLDGDSTTSISAVGFSATAAVVVANDSGDSSKGYAHGITVSGGNMTAVDSKRFNLTQTTYLSAAALSATRVFVSYFNEFNAVSSLIDFSGGTVDVNVGSQTVLATSTASRMAASVLEGTTTVVVPYLSPSSDGKAVVATVSGTTQTYNSASTFTNASFNNLGAAPISSTKVVIAYQDNSNSGRGTALVATYGPQTSSSSEGGGGDARWLLDLRKRNGLDAKGNPLSSTSSSIAVESSASSSSFENSVSSSSSSVSPISSSSSSVSRASSSSAKSVNQFTLFTDTPLSAWYYADLQKLHDAGVISGYKNKAGTDISMFGPGDIVNYGQFAKMVSLVTGHVPSGTKATMHWSEPYVRTARATGLSEYADTSLNLDMPVSRAEAVRTILEAYGISLSSLPQSTFSDLPSKHPYSKDILTAVALGIIEGDGNKKTVRPDATINRAEIVKILADVASRFSPVEKVPAEILAKHSSSSSSSSSSRPLLGKDVRFVATPTLNLRSDARINSTVLWELRKGMQMEVLRVVYTNWAQVRLADGREGYVWVHYLNP